MPPGSRSDSARTIALSASPSGICCGLSCRDGNLLTSALGLESPEGNVTISIPSSDPFDSLLFFSLTLFRRSWKENTPAEDEDEDEDEAEDESDGGPICEGDAGVGNG